MEIIRLQNKVDRLSVQRTKQSEYHSVLLTDCRQWGVLISNARMVGLHPGRPYTIGAPKVKYPKGVSSLCAEDSQIGVRNPASPRLTVLVVWVM